MGKRSDFVRNERDYYPTPIKAVEPLIAHLPDNFTFAEPCAGDGRLVNHISTLTDNRGNATFVCDIDPQEHWIPQGNALDVVFSKSVDFIITNPPWDRKILHPMIEHFSSQAPTWLLFDANWMFTKQAHEYLPYCVKIVTIGRVRWIEDTKMSGKDDSCWYLFDKKNKNKTLFFGRDGS